IKEETLTFYKPVITKEEYNEEHHTLTINGKGFSSKADNNVLHCSKKEEEKPIPATRLNTPTDELTYQLPNNLAKGKYNYKVTVNSVETTSETFEVTNEPNSTVTEIETFYIDKYKVKIRLKGEKLPDNSKDIHFSTANYKNLLSHQAIGFSNWDLVDKNNTTAATFILNAPEGESISNTKIHLGKTKLPFVCFKNVLLVLPGTPGQSNATLYEEYLKTDDCYFLFMGDNLYVNEDKDKKGYEGYTFEYSIRDDENDIIFQEEDLSIGRNNIVGTLGANTRLFIKQKKEEGAKKFQDELKGGNKYKFVCTITDKKKNPLDQYNVTLPFYIIPSMKR
ncbi:MAG: hypothetical protein ACRCR9_02960, partial [Chitinophagaceae bacterium]